jgi:hypothetical protein
MKERSGPVREEERSLRHADGDGKILESKQGPVGRADLILAAPGPGQEQGEPEHQGEERAGRMVVPSRRFFSYHRPLMNRTMGYHG